MIPKCKAKDFIYDLTEVYNVTEITMDISGIGLVIADLLKQKGVKVKEIRRKNKYFVDTYEKSFKALFNNTIYEFPEMPCKFFIELIDCQRLISEEDLR